MFGGATEAPLGEVEAFRLRREMKALRESFTAADSPLVARIRDYAPAIPLAPEREPVTRYQDLLLPAPPAVGQPFIYTVPGSYMVRPVAVVCRVTLSGAGSARAALVEWQTDQGFAYCFAGSPGKVAPGTSQRYCWQEEAGAVVWPVDDVALAGLPRVQMRPAHKLVVTISGMDTGDQISEVGLLLDFESTAPLEPASE